MGNGGANEIEIGTSKDSFCIRLAWELLFGLVEHLGAKTALGLEKLSSHLDGPAAEHLPAFFSF